MVVAVSLHRQQSDDLYKIQKENANGSWAVIYVWHFIVLSFWPSCICECWTAVRATVACPLQQYWLLNLFTCPTVTVILIVRNSGEHCPAGLVTTGCLLVRLGLWQPWHPFPNSSQLTLLDTLTSLPSVSTVSPYTTLGYSQRHQLLGRLILCQHSQDHEMLCGKEQSVYATQCFGSKHSPKVWEMQHNL
jgi:hypothetical protein